MLYILNQFYNFLLEIYKKEENIHYFDKLAKLLSNIIKVHNLKYDSEVPQTPWHHFVHPLKTGTQLLCTLFISQIFGMAALTKLSVPVTQALVDALNSTYFSQCPWLHHALKTKQMQVRINSEFQGKRFTTSYNKIENFGSTTNPGS